MAVSDRSIAPVSRQGFPVFGIVCAILAAPKLRLA
jgi:hypothetical protein